MLKLLLVACSILCVAHCNTGYAGRRPRTDCSAVSCIQVHCPNPIPPPPGECCNTCPNPGPVDCRLASCPQTFCPNPIPPTKGQCCPTCTRDCTVVRCAQPPPCLGGQLVFPPGGCCLICELGKRPCIVGGIRYEHGSNFMDECNTCTCSDGSAGCSTIGCAPGCYKNGQRYTDGQVVPSKDPCEKCTCSEFQGKFDIVCALPGCAPPPCSNHVTLPGKCCPECPDCKEVRCGQPPQCPGGQLVFPPGGCCQICELGKRPCIVGGIRYEHGSNFMDECNTCTCSDGSAGCTKIGCAPGCWKDGKRYDAGVKLPSTDACLQCTCYLFNGKYTISCPVIDCARPTCQNPVQVPGRCCLVCGACIVGGKTYLPGETFKDKCNTCTCTDGTASCTEIGCAPGCYKNGQRYTDGQVVPSKDPCEYCMCSEFQGKFDIACALPGCAPPPCPNPVTPPGKCCPECPGTKCQDGTSPHVTDFCGGLAGLSCPDGYHCDNSKAPPNSADFPGICCKDQGQSCNVDGKIYKNGESFNIECNGCSCSDGAVLCTLIACGPGCYKDRIQYLAGQNVPTSDPCESCMCTESQGKFKIICALSLCAKPTCPNPVKIPGQCCPECPGPRKPLKCQDGSLPLKKRKCGGIVGRPCPNGYRCDTSNNPPGSADKFGICCKRKRPTKPKCRNGNRPHPKRYCGGITGLQCPRGHHCDTSNMPPNSADFPGMCCRGENCEGGVRCPPITCLHPTNPKGKCCPVCPKDCTKVICPPCKNPVKAPGKCCPNCGY